MTGNFTVINLFSAKNAPVTLMHATCSSPDIGVWWRPKTANIGLKVFKWPETRLQMNNNVAPYVLDV